MDYNPAAKSLTAFAVGVSCHVFLFCRGEWDLATPKILASFAAVQTSLFVCLVSTSLDQDHYLLSTFKEVSGLGICLVLGTTLSMLVYRAAFHRLNRFPGPFIARLSNLYVTMLSAKDLHLYEEVEALHRKYGDFVRLGPSELSVKHPAAVSAIYQASSPCTKGPWYNILHPRVSLHMVWSKGEHARRRRIWDRGFSAKALREYEPRVAKHTNQLLAHIDATAGTPLNVTDWFNFYSFDVMGDLSFGKSFGMLQGGIKHYFMTALHADMTNIGLFSHATWLFPLFKITPLLNHEHLQFWKWLGIQVDERKKMDLDRHDVFSWLLEEHRAKQQVSLQDELDLCGDAYLIVVAGSDTTAASLTALFFQLALEPNHLQTLQNEVDALHRDEPDLNSAALSKLKHLDAVINETLRLHPAVPSGVHRITPPEGLLIADTFIPGETIVQVPYHTMFRDKRNFERPDEFIPERWTTETNLTKDASVFMPFSVGPYSCIGKQLGLMEIRYVTAQIVHKYNVAFAPSQSPEVFLKGKRDTFTLALGPLDLVFSPRKQVS